MSQQEIVTDQLALIIQNILLKRETGLLTVRRGEGTTLEEGTIAIVNGQVIEAKVGHRTGPEVLNWLSTWRNCMVSFVPSNTSTVALPITPPPLNVERDTSRNFVTPPTPISSIRRRAGQLDASEKKTGELEPSETSAPISGAPYHTEQLDSALRTIEQRGLSRTHRHLFLLIDGQRSLTDLMRLTARSQDEMDGLLRDLERAQVIRVPRTL